MKPIHYYIVLASVLLIGAAVALLLQVKEPSAAVVIPNPLEKVGEPITMTLVPEPEGPAFERKYFAPLPDHRSIEIVMKNDYHYGYSRMTRDYSYAILTQENGNLVSFNPHRIADHIIDPALVPMVTDYSVVILKLDADWWAEQPAEYTTKSGQTWRRTQP